MFFPMSNFKHVSMFFFLFMAFNCFSMFGSNAQSLPQDEGTVHFFLSFFLCFDCNNLCNFRNCHVFFLSSELWNFKLFFFCFIKVKPISQSSTSNLCHNLYYNRLTYMIKYSFFFSLGEVKIFQWPWNYKFCLC